MFRLEEALGWGPWEEGHNISAAPEWGPWLGQALDQT